MGDYAKLLECSLAPFLVVMILVLVWDIGSFLALVPFLCLDNSSFIPLITVPCFTVGYHIQKDVRQGPTWMAMIWMVL
jgi:hypothetical protein